ncbi:MAG TPA: LPS assembly protein LptD [Candidatus Polarisedimenticolaceae bacterium]|nr:LPS assembly protein LptD [Candidatus Polarisedimenticolaceae bacterium]
MALFRPSPRALFVFLISAAASVAGAFALSAEPPKTPPAGEKPKVSGLPPGVSLSAENISRDEQSDAIVAEGAVTIESEMGRIQADRITFREGHLVEAEGNVLVVWQNNRISGTRMAYDMGIKDDPDPQKRIPRGVIENAIGQVDPEFYFEARKVETIGDDRVILESATVTTCTQPVPYWSFHVSKAKIKIDGYAHLFNLRPAIKNVPFFYLPYLMWPVKRDRAPGLLFPEFGSTTARGKIVSIPVFVPLGASADITLLPEYYTIAGWGGGVKLRLIPNRDGYAEGQAQYIADQVTGTGRYRVQLKQTQSFLNGFRMVSDVDIVSDFDYYTDFVRNLTYASSPTILGRLTFTRSGSWTSLQVQEQYREQLFSDGSTLVQTTLPEIEWRGRSRQVGKSPLYFSYASSFAGIRQDGALLQTDYLRGDVGPTLSAPFSPWPWVDVTPTLAVRSTYWTKHLEPVTGAVADEGLWRNLLGAGIDLRGPKLFRIFETKGKPAEDGSDATPPKKFKNTIEPRVAYTYQQAFDRNDEIIVYDEVDRFGTNSNALTYGLASRLIGQRRRAAPEQPVSSGERILVPEGDSGKLREAPSAIPTAEGAPPPGAVEVEEEKSAPLEPIEIASLEIAQSYSFNSTPSTADVHGNCIAAPVAPPDCREVSHFSQVALTGRYNPTQSMSFNLGGRYDVLFGEVSEISLSGNFRERLAQGLFSFVHRPGLGFQRRLDPVTGQPIFDTATGLFEIEPVGSATQLRFQGSFGPIVGRVRIGADATYNFSPSPAEKHLPYQRWRLEYYTQCCGFLAEYLKYDYTTAPRREIRFAVDLRGIGKLFDFNQGNQ